ncbi:MAG: hypothetical protein SF162_08060 [bacterium]|nr:hypothetical protein [bacterium]
MAKWMKYKNADNITEIFDIDQATRFRHVEEGDSTFIEIHAAGAVHTIMWLTDKEAFHKILEHIRTATGFALE